MRRRRGFISDPPRPSVGNPREILLAEVLTFVRAASRCGGVRRISLVGSLATPKPVQKDADVVVALDANVDLAELAGVARRLKGRAGSINLGADIFLCDPGGRYFGRVCGYRECHTRAACEAHSCGLRPHLNDDLHVVRLDSRLTRAPPFDLWPTVVRRGAAPDDVEHLLLRRLEASRPQISSTPGAAG
jgi:hypothetical protein